MLHKMKGLIAAIALTVGALPAFAQDRTLTYATYLPQSFTWVQVDDWFMDEVEKRTEGRIKFEKNYGGSLLGAVDVLPGLSSGAADVATGAPIYNADILPLSSGVIQPFVTERVDAAVAAFIELYETNDALRQEWSDNNMHLLYAMVATENAFWTNKPIHSASDLKGMRIRASGGVAQVIEMLGATPVAMGMGDGVQALKTGAIDGFTAAPFDVSTLVGLQDIATYAGDAGNLGVYATVAMGVNLNLWNGLPDDIKAIMSEIAQGAPAKFLEVTNASVTGAIEKINAAENLEVVRTSAEESASWKTQTAEPIWNAWIERNEEKGIPARATFEQFRGLIAKYEANSIYTPGFTLIENAK